MIAPAAPIKLFAGIGNPGARYARTRHNAGFWFADALAASLGLSFAARRKFNAEVARGERAEIIKPQTFVNASGAAVAAAAKARGIRPEEILVIHDEIDLPPGAVKIKFNGGSAGHNGLKDIGVCLAAKAYWRLRLGVGRPPKGDPISPADYVLQAPPPGERECINAAIARALDQTDLLLRGDLEAAMLRLHTRSPDPSRPSPDIILPSPEIKR